MGRSIVTWVVFQQILHSFYEFTKKNFASSPTKETHDTMISVFLLSKTILNAQSYTI